jgi:hypothetical protein
MGQDFVGIPRFPGESDRGKFKFADIVRSSFDFLITDFGFSIIEENVTLVRFESDRMAVNVFHGRSSYELGVEIGPLVPKGKREFRYSLSTVLAALDTEGTADYEYLQTSSPEVLPGLVAKLANMTLEFAPDLLRGNSETCKRVLYQAWLEGRRTTDASNAKSLRQVADKAWKNNDFAVVVDSYTKIKALETAELTSSELVRLRHARWELDNAKAKDK